MILPVPTACGLACDKCHRAFFFNGNHIFSSTEDARARASVCGWTHSKEHDLCPSCQEKARQKIHVANH